MAGIRTIKLVLAPKRPPLPPPLKLALTLLIAVGSGLAATAAVLSAAHNRVAQVPAFATVTLALAVLSMLVWREVRWAVLITLIALAGQSIAVAGIVVELTAGIAPAKASQLRELGFDPTVGVIINLIYSSTGLVLFGWYGTLRLKRR
jgi:hypothetical protein